MKLTIAALLCLSPLAYAQNSLTEATNGCIECFTQKQNDEFKKLLRNMPIAYVPGLDTRLSKNDVVADDEVVIEGETMADAISKLDAYINSGKVKDQQYWDVYGEFTELDVVALKRVLNARIPGPGVIADLEYLKERDKVEQSLARARIRKGLRIILKPQANQVVKNIKDGFSGDKEKSMDLQSSADSGVSKSKSLPFKIANSVRINGSNVKLRVYSYHKDDTNRSVSIKKGSGKKAGVEGRWSKENGYYQTGIAMGLGRNKEGKKDASVGVYYIQKFDAFGLPAK